MQNTEQTREDGVQVRVLHRFHNHRVCKQHVNLLRVNNTLSRHISFSPVSHVCCESVTTLRWLRPLLQLVRPPLLLLRTASFIETVTGISTACPHSRGRQQCMLDTRLRQSKAVGFERGLACLARLRLMRQRVWRRARRLAR